MEEKIKALREQMEQRLNQTDNREKLAAFWQDFLGKKGQVAELMKGLGAVAKEDRPAMGKVINEFKTRVEELYKARSEKIEELEMAARNRAEQVDITLPAKERPIGTLHPITLVRNEMINVFAGMGFEIFEGPEIEDDAHNFTRLNVPKDHPSRDMQDTFYITEDILLRTQTSGGQIRVMDLEKPPIKVLVPGRVFRSDSDATHSPMFHQMEGLVIDKGITMADLKGSLTQMVKLLYGEDSVVRFRPHHFPFTEPSCEVDVRCFKCGGHGQVEGRTCPTCHGEGWIEILGAGMVHPWVLEGCGIDPEEYSGFAFGCGVERMTMNRFAINDLRLIFENDVRFLEQF